MSLGKPLFVVERQRKARRLSLLLCESTGGRLSFFSPPSSGQPGAVLTSPFRRFSGPCVPRSCVCFCSLPATSVVCVLGVAEWGSLGLGKGHITSACSDLRLWYMDDLLAHCRVPETCQASCLLKE